MKNPQLKKRYLACAIPALLLAGLEGCSNGTTTSTGPVEQIKFSYSITPGESVIWGESFTVEASVLNPTAPYYNNSSIAGGAYLYGSKVPSSTITVASCPIQIAESIYKYDLVTSPCNLNVIIESNTQSGTYYLIMGNVSINSTSTANNLWCLASRGVGRSWSSVFLNNVQMSSSWLSNVSNICNNGPWPSKSSNPFYLPEVNEIIPFTVVAPVVTESKYIFLTESLYTGALGGVAGANAACKSDSNNPLGAESGTWKAALYNNNPVFTVGESYTLWADYPYSYANGTYNPTESTFSAESEWIAPLVIGTFRDTWFQSAGIQAHCHGGSAGIGWTTNGGAHQGEFIRIQPTHLSEPLVPPATATCSQEKRLICIQQ